MPDLTKTVTVLDLVRQPAADEENPVFRDDSHPEARTTEVILDRLVWDDMDRPVQVTVTVEPGDLLNA